MANYRRWKPTPGACEIFFAERWLIVEGQADYLIVHAVAHAMEDDQHGVLIDAQSNPPPLRRWRGRWTFLGWQCSMATRGAGFVREPIRWRSRTHPGGDLETQLVADGLGAELRETLAALDIQDARELNDEDLVVRLRADKTTYAAAFAARIRGDTELAQRAPDAFRAAVKQLRGLA